MNILFLIRSDYLDKSGGDTFQALKTKEYLEKNNNVKIDIQHDIDNVELSNYDIIHIFNIQIVDFAYNLVKKCRQKSQTIPILFSPIIWDMSDGIYTSYYFKYFSNYFICGKFRFIRKLVDLIMLKHRKKIQYILTECSCLLPNSLEEDEFLKRKYKTIYKSIIVPNCIDIKMTSEEKKIGFKDYILEVGRIEPIKNQLGVLKAMMKQPDIPIIFIGKKNQSYIRYLNKLDKLAKKRGNTFFIEHMPQDELISYYKNAKVHVLPSFRESPGLVSLEALYYNTNIVVSNKEFCPTGYYNFEKMAYICNPYNLKSIRNAILNATNDNNIKVDQQYFNFISYENAAQITYDAYQKCINNFNKNIE